MVKVTDHEYQLHRCVIFSGLLHLILIAFLIPEYLQKNVIISTVSGDSSVVDVILVDASILVKESNKKHKKHNTQCNSNNLRQKTSSQIVEAIQKKKEVENKHIKIIDKKRLLEYDKQKKAEITTAKSDKPVSGNTSRLLLDKKNKATAKQSSEIDNLFNILSASEKNVIKNEQKKEKNRNTSIQESAENIAMSNADINYYIGQIRRAIQSKFYESELFIGKTCDLRILLSQDGQLINLQKVGGDLALCQAAISAAKLAQIPKPPSDTVYQYFKNFTLEFKPQ